MDSVERGETVNCNGLRSTWIVALCQVASPHSSQLTYPRVDLINSLEGRDRVIRRLEFGDAC